MSILRPYQRMAIDALRGAIDPATNRVATEIATGLGKTITFAAMIDEWLDRARPSFGETEVPRALVLVHTNELVRQAVEKILAMTGGHITRDGTIVPGRWTVGVVKARENDVHADIVVASVQTLAQPGRKEQITDVGMIVVDEAHHGVAPSYVSILRHFGAMPATADYEANAHDATWRPTPTFGFSATMARTDGQGLGSVWQDMPFTRSLPWGIRKGYLIDLIPYTITIPGIDPGASDSTLDAQMADSIAPEAVVGAWLDKTARVDMDMDNDAMYHPRPSTILFAPLVKSAQAFADAFNAAGVKAEVVSGSHGDEHNAAVLARYEAGTTTLVCNAMKLTEGWDSPRTMCVIVARPTRSVPLFVQMIGRGLRQWLDVSAPPRADQFCTLLCVQGTTTDVVTVADLSDKIADVSDGKSFLAMEDEYDLGKDIPEDADTSYRGPVRVEQWDMLVQRSSKAWKYTAGGIPFLPIRKRGQGYVFIVDTANGHEVWARMATGQDRVGAHVQRQSMAPDLELAMAMAEDTAQDLGGDIGALLADKTRAWRKAVPSMEALAQARRAGVDESNIQKILTSRTSGKAGKLSDLIDTVTATRVLDGNAQKIRERASK